MYGNSGPELCAVYNVEGGRQESRPVLGWDDEGFALTVDWSEGRLKKAAELPGFSHLDDDEVKHSKVLTVLPAPEGWHLVTREVGRTGVHPIVGWVVNGFGCGDPLVISARGDLEIANTQRAVACSPGEDPQKVVFP
jgi:hypothetical protein